MLSFHHRRRFAVLGLRKSTLRLLLVFALLLLVQNVAVAQVGTPIQPGQPLTGDISAAAPSALYTYTASAGETVTIQVAASGFIPQFHVLSPTNAEVVAVPNPDSTPTVQGAASFDAAGPYTIEVSSAESVGTFTITVTGGQPAAQPAVATGPVDLTAGQPVAGALNVATPTQEFNFTASPSDTLLLTVKADNRLAAPAVSLRDARTGRVIATADTRFTDAIFLLPLGSTSYVLAAHYSGSPGDERISVCVEPMATAGACASGGTAALTPSTTNPTTTADPSANPAATPIPATSSCTASSKAGGVYVRVSPESGAHALGLLHDNEQAPVLGTRPGNGWYQINLNGQTGWVGVSVINLQGDCANVPIVS
jgi:hypothetical protein